MKHPATRRMGNAAAGWLAPDYKAALQVRHGLLVLLFTAITGIAGYHFLCGWSFTDACYMLIITISTVGYGEIGPFTPWARWVNCYVILLGITAAAYTFGGLLQLMAEGQFRRLMEQQKQTKRIDALKNHHIICGFGRMGQMLCHQLAKRDEPLVIIEMNPERAEEAQFGGYLCVVGDANEEGVLKEAGIERARSLVCVLPDDAENVFVTLTGRNMNQKLFITARAERQTTERKLVQAGADRVVAPQYIGALRIVNLLTRPTTVEILELATGAQSIDLEMNEVTVPDGSSLAGLTLSEADIRHRTGVIIVAIKRHQGDLMVNPESSTKIHAHDTVVILGRRNDTDAFRREYAG